MAAARGRRASASTQMAAASAADIPATADVATATTTDISTATHVASTSVAAHTRSSTDVTTHAWRASPDSHAAIPHGAARWTVHCRAAIHDRPRINDRSGTRAVDAATRRPRTDPGTAARTQAGSSFICRVNVARPRSGKSLIGSHRPARRHRCRPGLRVIDRPGHNRLQRHQPVSGDGHRARRRPHRSRSGPVGQPERTHHGIRLVVACNMNG